MQIELQRAKNCEIMLRNIKMPLPDLMVTLYGHYLKIAIFLYGY